MNGAKSVTELADAVLDGAKLSRFDGHWLLTEAPSDALFCEADHIRRERMSEGVELCSILSVKGGACWEDCRFCAQSSWWETGCASFPLLGEERVLEAARQAMAQGVHRFSLVSSGRMLNERDFGRLLETVKALRQGCPQLKLCASLGFLDGERAGALREAGVDRYHHNLETSRAHFFSVCTTHTFYEKIATLRIARHAGLSICSGGILGLGESSLDRVDMAMTLREEGAASVPLNLLTPVPGTPFAAYMPPGEEEVLRAVATYRFLLPEADIRFAGGRQVLGRPWSRALKGGMSALMTGAYLTTAGSVFEEDKAAISEMGEKLRVSP